MSRNREPSQRQLRVGELLRHELASLLARGEIHEPVLQSVAVTVSEVRVSPDLKQATAYIVPLGGAHLPEVLEALMRARKYIRGCVGHAVGLKYAPQIAFEADTSFDYSDRIEAILHSPAVERDLSADEDG
ncbi:MAG: 30S ribosome-binding factor RbfA [Hyphomicrobiales bacterium]|mgnify:FL=1|nr:MAG: 30S ribosome-binding factor RbfA [Hyphomicrobiales bacterium]